MRVDKIPNNEKKSKLENDASDILHERFDLQKFVKIDLIYTGKNKTLESFDLKQILPLCLKTCLRFIPLESCV